MEDSKKLKQDKKYYDINVILNKKDLDGNKPSIYMITTNRSAGKTTSTLKYSLKQRLTKGIKTMLIYRTRYELTGANKIYDDVLKLYPELGGEMTITACAGGLFYELFLDKESFGYAVSLNNPDAIKKYSPTFREVGLIIMDEFQLESGKYLPNEVSKLESLLLTVARGGGKQSREVELFLLGNMVTIMNPYFIKWDIHKRLKDDTKFMKGHGWIAEFGYNESASKSIKSNGIFKAFSYGNSNYMRYSTEKTYLHDSTTFIETPKGKSKYICTILQDSTKLGVRLFYETGIVYVSKKPDQSCKTIITFKASDHTQNTLMLGHYSYLWRNIREAFDNGKLRFDDMKSKSIIFDILAVDIYK